MGIHNKSSVASVRSVVKSEGFNWARLASIVAPPKPRSRTSTSHVSWSELMKRTLGINVLQCPVCQMTMALLAVITKREVIDRILTHVKVHSSFSFRVASR